jgi:hypothetical protein
VNSAALLLLALAASTLSVAPALAQAAPAAAEKKPAAKTDSSNSKPSTPQTPRDQATALKEFEAEMKAIRNWTEEQTEKDKTNIARTIKLMPELVDKISAVRTDALPGEMVSGMQGMTKVFKEIAALFKDAPDEEKEMKTWIAGKMSDEGFNKKMQAISAEGKRIGDELAKAGVKYGIDVDMNKRRPKKSADDKPAEDKAGKTEAPGSTDK